MTLSAIAGSILKDQSFRSLRAALTARAIIGDFPAVELQNEPSTVSWGRALSWASVLVGFDDAVAQDAGLRIAQGCLVAADSTDHHRQAATILLERMGNRPALKLAEDRELVAPESWQAASLPLQMDVVRKRLELGIPTADGAVLEANPFQRRFWSALEGARAISVTAPTSAGKSYIVRRWIEERVTSEESFHAIYLVPTRALIEEVSSDLSADLADVDVGIYTIPWDADVGQGDREILVLTQERLHLLYRQEPDYAVDLLFVDEAHKFGDGARGVLLQQTVEETAHRNADAQMVFASPSTSNPELLVQGEPGELGGAGVVNSDEITVNQNLLWADQVRGKPSKWSLQAVIDGEGVPVGHFMLGSRPQPPSQRLPLVAVALGGHGGGNVVYVNGAAAAEKAALQIFDALGGDAEIAGNSGIDDLRELVQRTIHRQYALARVLRRGVAFHYGNMPLLVRTEIEDLFRSGSLRYLVCTSTLLEGVNLPCRNLFARNPKKGNGNPMSAADFWNLAGRAGRWGKEFQGNIVCVDASKPQQWPELPRRRIRRPIVRATEAALSKPEDLLAYVAAGAPVEQAHETPMNETMLSYLATRVASGNDLSDLPGLSGTDMRALHTEISQILSESSIPTSLVIRHAGISPQAMQRLLDRFRTRDKPEALALAPPESDDATESYVRALAISNDTLGSKFGTSPRQMSLAILITDWMQGHSLARLIASRINWLERKKRDYQLSAEIRKVMTDVEQVARFQAPKYLACFQDVLRVHLQAEGRQDVVEAAPDISMMLELGVSRQTEVSMMALGLSRTTAVAVGELIVADDLGRDQALAWLDEQRAEDLDLPALVRREIVVLLTRTGRRGDSD